MLPHSHDFDFHTTTGAFDSGQKAHIFQGASHQLTFECRRKCTRRFDAIMDLEKQLKRGSTVLLSHLTVPSPSNLVPSERWCYRRIEEEME